MVDTMGAIPTVRKNRKSAYEALKKVAEGNSPTVQDLLAELIPNLPKME